MLTYVEREEPIKGDKQSKGRVNPRGRQNKSRYNSSYRTNPSQLSYCPVSKEPIWYGSAVGSVGPHATLKYNA